MNLFMGEIKNNIHNQFNGLKKIMSHSFYKIWLHAIWAVKDRQKLIFTSF